ncbi:cysteine desulfurase family protein [Altibacter sp. HG106]|uniref:cysteine desulfurase family protein n=1 Tax=Altibacter sp. HG106 TaxID=3023937 RepID=UPI0023509A8B|nr:cysteine desulfurase family protein [Altibacter sp. HG106]MDC7996179.1 cysteine desulfurase family protein [Altibacter sp. HG106]
MKKVYFDSAATTQLRNEVIYTMGEVLKTEYGNPSSTHSYGRSSKSLLENSRKVIARQLNAQPSEIIFTSGGTEADNLILHAAVRDLGVTRIITTKIEHHAVLHTVQALKEQYDIEIEYLSVDRLGFISNDELCAALSKEDHKTLVSLMHINNEVGSMMNLKEIALLCKEHHALFHSDTVQSIGHFPLDFSEIPIDFAVAAAHKFHGPKGVGFAFIRKNSGLKSLITGGSQERGLRAGTEPVYAIAGMAEALKLAYHHIDEDRSHVLTLKKAFIEKLQEEIPEITYNGACRDHEKSTYTILNVCLPLAAEKATLLHFQLDLKGIACSKGSACQSGSDAGSHVLSELLSEEDLQKPSVRFSFSKFNTLEEVDYVVSALKEVIFK